ncbi:hypothetical protein QJQ45_017620 [Haematococcus lacustris]|nr:hypothetical protein QJQ45_017620 [Haematococcus lacustris]
MLAYQHHYCSQFSQSILATAHAQYGEFRVGYAKDDKDTRMVAYGIRYLIENYIAKQWTMQDIDNADTFYRTHMAPLYTEFPFPRSIFEQFVKENNGWFPVKIQALPEGTVTHCRVPVYQVRGQAPATTAAPTASHQLRQRELRLHQV